MSILAIDFGLKKLGLAISQGFLAAPFAVLPNNKNLFSNLEKICAKNQIEKIIIGLPEGKLRERIFQFGKNCQKKLGIEVVFEDEVFTTKKAQKFLIEAGKTAKLRKKIVDAAAASVILQQYLDTRND